jgi:hypothetical protein
MPANLFSSTAKVHWLSGQAKIKIFHVPSTRHEKTFCSECGSALPRIQMNGALLVISAGSLDTAIRYSTGRPYFCRIVHFHPSGNKGVSQLREDTCREDAQPLIEWLTL